MRSLIFAATRPQAAPRCCYFYFLVLAVTRPTDWPIPKEPPDIAIPMIYVSMSSRRQPEARALLVRTMEQELLRSAEKG